VGPFVSLVSLGIPFYAYPILITFSTTLNLECTPLEAHAILLSIEQSLMPGKTGKRHERAIAELNGDDFFTALQDYDWADEVLHSQIGRVWYVPEFGSLQKSLEYGDQAWSKVLSNWATVNSPRTSASVRNEAPARWWIQVSSRDSAWYS